MYIHRMLPRSSLPTAEDEAYPIRIRADGVWEHEGTPIARLALVQLFARALTRDAAGDYWLITPAERGRIAVVDVPFVVVEAEISGCGAARRLRLRTNIEEWVEVGPEHPLEMREYQAARVPYVRVRGPLWARVQRNVYYQLMELVDADAEDAPGFFAGGQWISMR